MTLPPVTRLAQQVALVAALVLIALLVRQHRELADRNRELRMRTATLGRGDVVPVFRTASSKGDSLTIGQAAPGGRQVLFFLTKECPYCRATLPIWREMADRVTNGDRRISVTAVALDSLEQMPAYLAASGLDIPVIMLPDRRMRKLFRAGIVPETVVLSDSGTVLHAHAGVFTNAAMKDSVVLAALDSAGSPIAAPQALTNTSIAMPRYPGGRAV